MVLYATNLREVCPAERSERQLKFKPRTFQTQFTFATNSVDLWYQSATVLAQAYYKLI